MENKNISVIDIPSHTSGEAVNIMSAELQVGKTGFCFPLDWFSVLG